MLARSTGLGKSMLQAELKNLAPTDDLLILHLDTSEPEGWHLRAAMQLEDIPALIKGFCKPAIIMFLIRSLFFPKKNPREPKEF
jgi:hypothetical protein